MELNPNLLFRLFITLFVVFALGSMPLLWALVTKRTNSRWISRYGLALGIIIGLAAGWALRTDVITQGILAVIAGLGTMLGTSFVVRIFRQMQGG